MPPENFQPDACGPFNFDQCGDLTLLRLALETNGYTKEALAELNSGRERSEPLDVCLLQRRILKPSLFHTLVRLYFIGDTVPLDEARPALVPMSVEQLLAVGLLRRKDAGIRSAALLMPGDEVVVAHDFPSEVTGAPLAADHVLGVGRASLTLANMTVRRRHEKVLDVGTGCGIQALLASEHGRQVVGTDINPRALNFAALNARLNGIANVELRQGALYEPVSQDQFDLIVANPPFVISPAARYVYRDSALPGDAISEQVIRGAPARLREDGYCIVLCNWHHILEQDWSERPRQWVEASGCDAWLLCLGTQDPLSYAAGWLRSSEGQDRAQYGQYLDEWMHYYTRMGIENISSGVVILRRRTAQFNWLRADSFPLDLQTGSCSGQILRIFAAQDMLETLRDNRALLDHAFVLAPDHEMEHSLQVEEKTWRVRESSLKLLGGLGFIGPVDRLVSVIVAGCDGHRFLRELVTDVARGLHLDVDSVVPPCLEAVRRLMQSGFLSVAEHRTTHK